MRTSSAAAAFVAASLLIAAPAVAASTKAAQDTMTIRQFAFLQPKVHVHIGDSMTWTNDDAAPHDVTSTGGPTKLKSPLLMRGQSWKYTFTKAGSYDYICSVHPNMKATLVVEPAVAQKAAAAPAAATTATLLAASAAAPVAVEPAAAAPADSPASLTDALPSVDHMSEDLRSAREYGGALVGILVIGLVIVAVEGATPVVTGPSRTPTRTRRRPPWSR